MQKTLAKAARQAQSVAVIEDTSAAQAERAAALHEVLRKIHPWVTTWQEMGRTVITRRDQRIRLGIGRRRTPKPKAAPVVTAPAAPVTTPAATAPSDNGPDSRAA